MDSSFSCCVLPVSFDYWVFSSISLWHFSWICSHNYQVTSWENCSKRFAIGNVGYWDGSASGKRLHFYEDVTEQFGLNELGNIIYKVISQYQVCNPELIKRDVVSFCCVTCDPCLGQNYINYTSSRRECQACPHYMWGNSPLSDSNEGYVTSHKCLLLFLS